MDLNILWFVLLTVLLAGYCVLDGFDLGVGILSLFFVSDERPVLHASIAPFWDGNEVWLLTFGGALFAAFPHAYATVFSAFYLAFILLLMALISRAVSLEFRGKAKVPVWLWFWDWGFFKGSFLASLLLGVAGGNLMAGIPVGADMEFSGTFPGLLGPFPILVGLFAVALFAQHGGLYLCVKTEGALLERCRALTSRAQTLCGALMVGSAAAAFFGVPALREAWAARPVCPALLLGAAAALGASAPLLRYGRCAGAFAASAAGIVFLIALFASSLYPALVRSSLDPAWSLTITSAASSPKTLAIMRNIAFVGMPLVIAYTAFIHWVFRGKVKAGAGY